MRSLTLLIALLLGGCCGPDLRPSVRLLRDTIKDVRRDYESGRVDAHEHVLEGRLLRLSEAEKLANIALGESR